jgi:hypothetical protein
MSFWKKLFGGDSKPQIPPSKPHPQPPAAAPESPPKPVEKDDSTDLQDHKIGRDGICLICGCTESAIRSFNWKCKRPRTPSPKVQPKDESSDTREYVIQSKTDNLTLYLNMQTWQLVENPRYATKLSKEAAQKMVAQAMEDSGNNSTIEKAGCKLRAIPFSQASLGGLSL